MANNQVLFKRSNVKGKKPLVANTVLGEIAINTNDGRLYTKRSYLNETNDPTEAIVEFVGKVPVGNTFFVSKNGSDINDGTSWDTAFATIEKALTEATARNGLITLIDIGPGEYETAGHLDLPDNCMVRAVHRTVIFKPKDGFKKRNVFRMGSGCFIEGPLFEGWQLDSLDNPREGFAISFRPGAIITRAPYAHKIAIRTPPTWSYIAPPLDAANGNPLVDVGAGVVLADGAVCSPYSIFPNIMTWGATPVTHNGIGYLAKNGALINAVNAVSLWCHKHFMAANGGQIILSSCSTQFGDYTLVATGGRYILFPLESEDTKVIQPIPIANVRQVQANTTGLSWSPNVYTPLANSIITSANTIANTVWNQLVSGGYTTGWTAQDEAYTRRDSKNLLKAISRTLDTANETYMLDFARGLFYYNGNNVIESGKRSAVDRSFVLIANSVVSLPESSAQSNTIVNGLISSLRNTFSSPVLQTYALSAKPAAAAAIRANANTIANNVWNKLVSEGYVTGWSPTLEAFTRRDSNTYLYALANSIGTGIETPITNFNRSLFYSNTSVANNNTIDAFYYSYNYLRDGVIAVASSAANEVSAITTSIQSSLTYPIYANGATLTVQSNASIAINTSRNTIINNLWSALANNGYTTGWDYQDEVYTRRDANTLLQSLIWTLQTANEKPMLDFAKGLFDTMGNRIYTPDKQSAFIYSFNIVRDEINALPNVNSNAQNIVTTLLTALTTDIVTPVLRVEPSTITAIGHTFTGVGAGVALTKIPPVQNQASIQDSILEINNGRVIASGQDDQGNAIFVGGLEINSDTGELGGPPFEQAVNRIATRTAISRSF